MEEARIMPEKRKKQVIYLSASKYKFIKDLKLGDKGLIKTKGSIVSERVDRNDHISKIVRLNVIEQLNKSARLT